ncbi:MAG: cobalamin B12-binding domain-containing protein [Candidatus Saccharibacteria bacterium]|nr:cobalamin B12-binding domain-containing protein [Pseudorhodobacter sp.]
MRDLPDLTQLVPPHMRPGRDLLAEGRAMATTWRLGTSAFMRAAGHASEVAYKRANAGRIMQHAHIGFRSVDRTLEALRAVHGDCAAQGVTVDRFGITLDWSMGYPQAMRQTATRGTGIVLTGPEDFARITGAVPAATHFGDFMLGLPGALENTKAAIAAGATSLGNLGQYFTFRLPGWDNDVATTEATVTALGLIAAQDGAVLVHSNLDDGFAGLFLDMCCSLGMVLVEKHVVEGMIGAPLAHCYGHHFSDPMSRMAFHAALAQVSDTVGTMIFGNTVSYQSTEAGNYASLASYLLPDIMALGRWPTGHAVNPVPVTENQRIPDVSEIIDAQVFAHRLAQLGPMHAAVVDWPLVEAMAARLVTGGRMFAGNLLAGLGELGIDMTDPAQILLAIRRIGPHRLEAAFGPGPLLDTGRSPEVRAEWACELDQMAQSWLMAQTGVLPPLRVCIGTSDVHEHGKYLVERALAGLGVTVLDGGVSVDPQVLVDRALAMGADVIAVSTYNGVAKRYAAEVLAALQDRGARLPVLIGGKLNQVPRDSNTGLPVDVTAEIAAMGALPCRNLDDMMASLIKSGLSHKVSPR